MRKTYLIFAAITILILPAWSDSQTASTETGASVGLGVESIDDITYNTLSLAPDLSMGKIGIGLDLVLNYELKSDAVGNPEFDLRQEDWVPEDDGDFQDWLELYFSKILYLRYGNKGDDIYAKFGAISDATLGNGFIMGNYSNMLFRPEIKPLGLSFDLDSALFNLPYFGFESFVGNLAAFDVIGGRLYARPMGFMENEILKQFQLGYTIVLDNAPFHYVEDRSDNPDTTGIDESKLYNKEETVFVTGLDFKQPLLMSDTLSLALFGDIASEEGALGGMIGAGGRLVKIVTYGGQIRIMGEDFLPTYFNQSYDLDRASKYLITKNIIKDVMDPYQSWLASLGLSMIEDLLVMNVSVESPFQKVIKDEKDPDTTDLVYLNYPHLITYFEVKPGLLPNLSFGASYDKREIKEWADLSELDNSLIGARINYQTGPAVVSLLYNLTYNNDHEPDKDAWDVSTKLETAISLY